jgi:hypothetical protein
MDKIPFLCSRTTSGRLHAVSFLEPLDTAGGIDKFLLTGKERVAGRTDLRGDLGLGGTGLERIAAQTFNRHLGVFWVYSFFHDFLLAKKQTAVSS